MGFLLRMLLVMLAVPLIVMADWAVYHYAGTMPENVAVVISIPVIVYALWRLGRWDDDEFDPLSADRRRR